LKLAILKDLEILDTEAGNLVTVFVRDDHIKLNEFRRDLYYIVVSRSLIRLLGHSGNS
jgi:hypothetical protein